MSVHLQPNSPCPACGFAVADHTRLGVADPRADEAPCTPVQADTRPFFETPTQAYRYSIGDLTPFAIANRVSAATLARLGYQLPAAPARRVVVHGVGTAAVILDMTAPDLTLDLAA